MAWRFLKTFWVSIMNPHRKPTPAIAQPRATIGAGSTAAGQRVLSAREENHQDRQPGRKPPGGRTIAVLAQLPGDGGGKVTLLPRIDPEFAALCTPHATEEIASLIWQIAADGCREPLTVWQETGLLLDGHQRYRICVDQGFPFRVVERSFADRDAAAEWIVLNQLGRRNVTPRARAYLVGKLYLGHRGPRGNRHAVGCTAAQKVAAMFNTSARTVERNGRFAAAVDAIVAAVGLEAREKLLAADCAISMADVPCLADLPIDAQRLALATGRVGASGDASTCSNAAVRWEKSLHEVFTLIASMRDAGGVCQLARGWSLTERRRYAQRLAEVARALEEAADALTESEVPHAR